METIDTRYMEYFLHNIDNSHSFTLKLEDCDSIEQFVDFRDPPSERRYTVSIYIKNNLIFNIHQYGFDFPDKQFELIIFIGDFHPELAWRRVGNYKELKSYIGLFRYATEFNKIKNFKYRKYIDELENCL